MDTTLTFLANERVEQLRHDAEGVRAARTRRRLLRRRRTNQ